MMQYRYFTIYILNVQKKVWVCACVCVWTVLEAACSSPSHCGVTASQMLLLHSISPRGQQPVTSTLTSRAVGWNKPHKYCQLAHTHKYLYTRDPSKAYFTLWQNIYCTQLHCVSLSLIHAGLRTEMSSFPASVQFLNGSAVRVRLMVSQPTPSACISVHSHCPLSCTAGVFCVQLLTAAKPPIECSCFPEGASLCP